MTEKIEQVEFMPRLLPEAGDLDMSNIITAYPSFTYKLDRKKGRIHGYIDNMEAICQAVYKLLDTPCGVYPIYSPNYGLFLLDLKGLDHDFATSEIKRRISENALVDDRLAAVEDFNFSGEGADLTVSFRIISRDGHSAAIERRLYDL
ncbi:MAG: DUF2634 domain-containing protein [Bacillota bacterium]|jgi:hypothetical protein